MDVEEIEKRVRVLVHSELVGSIAANAPLLPVVDLLTGFARDLVSQAYEEAARVADGEREKWYCDEPFVTDDPHNFQAQTAEDIAVAIRAMKDSLAAAPASER